MTQIIGILNVTRDSFSDGGRYLDTEAAIGHARQMIADGAAVIDVGAESTHPDAEDVPVEMEIARLRPVIEALVRLRAESTGADGSPRFRISVDTYKPEVMRAVLARGIDIINDVSGFRDPESIAALRAAPADLIVMHSRSATGRAQRRPDAAGAAARPASGQRNGASLLDEIIGSFQSRVAELAAAGIESRRVILDPGMGFFLGSAPEPSLTVLRDLERITALGFPVCVSTSRKSFIGAVLGGRGKPVPVWERGAGTLATEIHACQRGVAYIRTHDVRALCDALRLLDAIATGRPA